jgi:hypothetical protein
MGHDQELPKLVPEDAEVVSSPPLDRRAGGHACR